MYLAFVDESDGSGIHSFAAVIGDEIAVRDLTAALNRVMAQACVDYGLPPDIEIHGHPMFHGKDKWSGVPPRALISVFSKVLKTVVESDVRMLARSIHDQRLAERQKLANYPVIFPPEQVCFQHILQRVNTLCQRGQTYGLLIADERGDRERHRERFATYQTQGTPGVYMHTTLDRLLDTVHFAPSHHSRMLQAADIVAFTCHRRRAVPQESNSKQEKVMANLWRTLCDSGKLYEPGIWP